MKETPALSVKGNLPMHSMAMAGASANRVASGNEGIPHNPLAFQSTHISSYGFITTLLVSLILFWAPLQQLMKFANRSEYSYIPLIPAISAFLIVFRRNTIFRAARISPQIGSFVVGGSILVLAMSKFLRIDPIGRLELSALAIVGTWCGLFILWYGTRATRVAILPLFLLLFMIPASERVMNAVVGFLQHGSAVLSYHLFRAIGVPAVREGMVISLPRLAIEVAPECSGIRSSISLLILTLAGANLYLRSGWNKVLLVSILIPLVIVKNAIRIVTLSTLALYVNPSFLTGRLHHKGGIVFFLIAVAMLFPIVAIMRRYEKKEHSQVAPKV
jgi:exosortase